MFYCDRVVSYGEFMMVLEQAQELGLPCAPKGSDIPDLTDGADVALTLKEMGADFSQFKSPYHHRIEAVVLFGDYSRFEVDVTDELWRTLPTLQQWWESRPKLFVSPEAMETIEAALSEEAKPEYLDEESDEDGDEDGVREPRPDDTPDDSAGETVPVGAAIE